MSASPKPTEGKRKRQRPRVLLGITGSVAAVKGPEICLRLVKQNCEVKVLLTQAGANFWNKAKEYDSATWRNFQELLDEGSESKVIIYHQSDEWQGWNRLGDPVLHIDLRDWADIAVIAPLSAHTLAKIANGLCDDTLTCVLRAWDLGHHKNRPAKPIVLAPAMNTAMWQHPLTERQLKTVQSFAVPPSTVKVVVPEVKTLACGEVGQGALATVDSIVASVAEILATDKSRVEA